MVYLPTVTMKKQPNVSNGYGLKQVDKSNRGAHGFKTVEDLAAWKKEEFEWKLSAEKRLGRNKNIILLLFRVWFKKIPCRLIRKNIMF